MALVAEVVLPDDIAGLDGYLRELVHGAAPGALEALIDLADREIRRAFPEVDATSALRRALDQPSKPARGGVGVLWSKTEARPAMENEARSTGRRGPGPRGRGAPPWGAGAEPRFR
ncbi:hypothetical protein [Streptomyces flavofungini]|uniref:hypothetical protein n=1 Tax=Streptomyces flavofungini TaxID=68200 RepID=UPI0025B13468|nr:hypothetical protein [Streptomyces flavofungini]WJV47364.1 hypothetical protein QUY26_18660 [Streptomyces flavofungini]